MKKIHVCLISDQPIPNLLPPLLEKPDQAVFLVSPEMWERAERLQKILERRGIAVQPARVASAYDFEAMREACAKIIRDNRIDTELTLNVTGGTKIAALAAFQTFLANHTRIIYLDTANNRLLQLAPKTAAVPVRENLVKINDCLAAYGMNPLPGPASGQMKRRPGLNQLAALLAGDETLLSGFNGAIARQGGKPRFVNCSLNALGEKGEQLAVLLEQCGAARRTGAANLNIPSPDRIFFCHGGWLEEYVYWCVKDLGLQGLDLAMNVEVEWGGKGRRPTKNEFDVLFTHANRLHLISCKASNPRQTASGNRATEALNELDALSDRAGGLFGRAMLVSARRLSGFDRERARKMKIRLVEAEELIKLADHLRDWLGPA